MTTPPAELIERLEKAQEGSRELDELVHTAIGSPGKDDPRLYAFEHGDYPPNYTTSLDAALTLVPEGWAVAYFGIWPGEPSSLKVLGTHKAPDGRYWHESTDGVWEAEAATPALAICIGALKAKESIHDR